ncbi:2Fe-2S iron-sulfur cluster binding domain-containing protein [Sinimarinibacterium sp. CAU 1509]|uniref:2Fe-2S iron-sulfur cluster binding domain-containing protein n=1 Tax=Sinimarinibacterium sp. CAU 1509 TaxID=2562283 RepID=UPI0010ACB8FE|nr:2Fe-2S iron-sulfur cluster binding domain-containing protein [Sinimarinibacterium sp. CAU 1509]TJY61950.1 2Fe-2S iron-sulfur cluster binding domain-containing protein [Sinimarinibacterium sp. CAU 1509]
MLDQLIAQSAPVSYSCHRGDCGQCAVDFVDGQVVAIDPAFPLWQGGLQLYLMLPTEN